MTKRKLLKYFKETPTDLKHLIFSYVSMMGEKYDKVFKNRYWTLQKYDNNQVKIYNYYDKEEKTKLEIMCLEALKKENEIKHEKKLKQLKERLERYEKFRSKLSQSSFRLRTRKDEALKEKRAYVKLEIYLQEKYYKRRFYINLTEVSDTDSESDSDTDSESDSDTDSE
mgnify:FL=1